MQKTKFCIEIIVHDDASNDGTITVIRKYAQKYKNLIKPIYQSENQYSKGILPSTYAYRRAKGKYIAICEGDDYWTDPYKLQKQVDLMEANKNISLCYHRVVRPGLTVDEDSYLIKDDVSTGFIPTCSVLFTNEKKIIDNFIKYSGGIISGDQFLFYLSSFFGEIKYLDFLGGVYNQTEHGITRKIGIQSDKWRLNGILMYSILFNISPMKNKLALIKVAQSSLFNAMEIGIMSPFITYPYHTFKIIVLGFIFYPKYTLYRIKSLKNYRG